MKTKFNYGKPVVAGVATFAGREESLKIMLDSIKDQVDKIVVYDNEQNPNITDLGKFYGLCNLTEDVFYFSMDDDILYPKTYVEDSINAIKRLGTIITFHGRILLGKGRSYYFGHQAYRCLQDVNEELIMDVAGTGVTAFDTAYFNPIKLIYSEDMKMSDLVFSWSAANNNKKITILKHKQGYIQQIEQDITKSICFDQQRKCTRQNQIADEIITLNRPK